MNPFGLLLFLGILAGFSLIIVTSVASSFITSSFVSTLLITIGALAVILFSLAIVFFALRSLIF